MPLKIKILSPYNKTIENDIHNGDVLLDVLRRNGILLNARCGGQGTCGRCAVVINGKKNLSCRYSFSSPSQKDEILEISIPELSRLDEIYAASSESIKAGFEPTTHRYPFSPIAERIFISDNEIPSDSSALWERLVSIITSRTGVDNITIALDVLKYQLAERINFENTEGWILTLFRDSSSSIRVLSLKRGNEKELQSLRCYGLAVDLGTTTVAVALVNLKNGEVEDIAVGYNRQITHGEDVITRITFAESPEGLDVLSHLAAETINNLASDIFYRNRISPEEDVWAVVISGNTVMTHIFYKINPYMLKREPFAPVVQFVPTVSPERLGLRVNPYAGMMATPCVSAYIGGDITVGLVATDMLSKKEKSLLVDAGTNGEIVFTDGDFIICASCSAGPAFEGVGIKSGMHAVDGAIYDVKIENGILTYKTINDKPPKGLCGSGLISLLCELLDSGIMDRSGKLNPSSSMVRNYNDSSGSGLEFVVVKKGTSSEVSGILSEDITLTETDIQNLMRSKGAIYMGIETILKETGFTLSDIDRIYVAGGFGSSLDIKKAIKIGMLPDIAPDKYNFIGNGSLKGAIRVLLSSSARGEVEDAARRMTYIDLGTNVYFMNEYTSTLFFPHTDIKRFPSYSKTDK